VSPGQQPRFLVLDELYHPRWHAFADGRELRIYPTNGVMRGIVVPAGVSRIELHFIPFVLTPAARLFLASGAALLVGTSVVLRRMERG